MSRLLNVLAPLALVQMAVPGPAQGTVILVPLCGESSGMAPLRLPHDDDGKMGQPCCKVCHISMRKRTGGDSCCAEEEDRDAA